MKIITGGLIAAIFATLLVFSAQKKFFQDLTSSKLLSVQSDKMTHGRIKPNNIKIKPQSVDVALGQVANRTVIPSTPQGIVNYGISESKDYRVEVNGKLVPVYTAMILRVRDVSGDSKNSDSFLTQASFVSFDFSGIATLKIQSLNPVKSATLRPISANITPQVQGDTISFVLDKPRKMMLEINGSKERAAIAPPSPLFVFSNPIETNSPKPGTPGVKYFAPGIHHIGHYKINSNETLYIAGGAIVEGTLYAHGVQNIKVLGHGILDGSHTEHKKYLGIDIYNSKNVLIDGIIIRDSPHWTIVPTRSEDVTIRNIKILNHRINGDGINPSNSHRVKISDSFIYSSDDSISIKGCTWWYQDAKQSNAEDITVTDSTLMTGWIGNGISIGGETQAPEIKNLTFRNLDFYSSGAAMNIIAGDRAIISNVLLENSRIERYFGWIFSADIKKDEYNRDKEWGRIDGLKIHNVNVIEPFGEGGFYLHGHDASHPITNILFRNMQIQNKPFSNIDQISSHIWPNKRPFETNFVQNLRVIP